MNLYLNSSLNINHNFLSKSTTRPPGEKLLTAFYFSIIKSFKILPLVLYVIDKLLEIDPKVKAIITNEYTQENVMTEYKKYGFAASIVKPLKMEALSNFLFEVGLGCRRS